MPRQPRRIIYNRVSCQARPSEIRLPAYDISGHTTAASTIHGGIVTLSAKILLHSQPSSHSLLPGFVCLRRLVAIYSGRFCTPAPCPPHPRASHPTCFVLARFGVRLPSYLSSTLLLFLSSFPPSFLPPFLPTSTFVLLLGFQRFGRAAGPESATRRCRCCKRCPGKASGQTGRPLPLRYRRAGWRGGGNAGWSFSPKCPTWASIPPWRATRAVRTGCCSTPFLPRELLSLSVWVAPLLCSWAVQCNTLLILRVMQEPRWICLEGNMTFTYTQGEREGNDNGQVPPPHTQRSACFVLPLLRRSAALFVVVSCALVYCCIVSIPHGPLASPHPTPPHPAAILSLLLLEAIKACGKGGQWEQALTLLREMAAEGCTPDAKSYEVSCIFFVLYGE